MKFRDDIMSDIKYNIDYARGEKVKKSEIVRSKQEQRQNKIDSII